MVGVSWQADGRCDERDVRDGCRGSVWSGRGMARKRKCEWKCKWLLDMCNVESALLREGTREGKQASKADWLATLGLCSVCVERG